MYFYIFKAPKERYEYNDEHAEGKEMATTNNEINVR